MTTDELRLAHEALKQQINHARLEWNMGCPHDDCGECLIFDRRLRELLGLRDESGT